MHEAAYVTAFSQLQTYNGTDLKQSLSQANNAPSLNRATDKNGCTMFATCECEFTLTCNITTIDKERRHDISFQKHTSNDITKEKQKWWSGGEGG